MMSTLGETDICTFLNEMISSHIDGNKLFNKGYDAKRIICDTTYLRCCCRDTFKIMLSTHCSFIYKRLGVSLMYCWGGGGGRAKYTLVSLTGDCIVSKYVR